MYTPPFLTAAAQRESKFSITRLKKSGFSPEIMFEIMFSGPSLFLNVLLYMKCFSNQSLLSVEDVEEPPILTIFSYFFFGLFHTLCLCIVTLEINAFFYLPNVIFDVMFHLPNQATSDKRLQWWHCHDSDATTGQLPFYSTRQFSCWH